MDPAAPNSPFKWETASGLEHSCFLCSMKMSNPKARQTCYGVHSMPCYRYHQTMHAIGTSHNCFSCIQADELHEGRHRKIAELLAEYKAATAGRDTCHGRPSLEEVPVNIPRPQFHADGLHPLDLIRARDLAEDDDTLAENDDAQTLTDTATSSAGDGVPPPKLTKAEARAMKKAAKAQKSQSKAFKNQQKHVVGVRTEDVTLVETVLHGDKANTPDTHPLASDKTIEEVIARNMGFMSSIEEHKKALLNSITQRRRSEKERRKSSIATASNASSGTPGAKKRRYSQGLAEDGAEEDMEDLLVAALCKLGVDASHIRSGSGGSGAAGSVKRGGGGGTTATANKGGSSASPSQVSSIVASLKALVRDDLERFENEQRETCVRAGGFWRYVGRPVFERMTVIARELDWKTGTKLKEQKD